MLCRCVAVGPTQVGESEVGGASMRGTFSSHLLSPSPLGPSTGWSETCCLGLLTHAYLVTKVFPGDPWVAGQPWLPLLDLLCST